MTGHQCKYEKEIAVMGERLKTLFKFINGNGGKGLREKVNDISEAVDNRMATLEKEIIKLSSQFSFKQWVQRGVIIILIGLVSWLGTLQFGG